MTRLIPQAHTLRPGHVTIEIWHDNEFVGQITAGDGRGIRVITKHRIEVENFVGDGTPLQPSIAMIAIKKHGEK